MWFHFRLVCLSLSLAGRQSGLSNRFSRWEYALSYYMGLYVIAPVTCQTSTAR